MIQTRKIKYPEDVYEAKLTKTEPSGSIGRFKKASKLLKHVRILIDSEL